MNNSLTLFLNVDTVKYTKKPPETDVPIIQNRCDKPQQITYEEFVRLVCSGCSFKASALNGTSAADFIYAQMIVIDIDNDNPNACIITPEEAVEKAKELGLYPNFMYPSFRNTEQHPKFRMVFILDIPITAETEWKDIYEFLLLMYPQADRRCNHVSRLFFGTNAKPILNNIQKLNSKVAFLAIARKALGNEREEVSHYAKKKAATKKKKESRTKKFDNQDKNIDTEMVYYIQSGNWEKLREKLDISTEPLAFDNHEEFYNYIYQEINLARLLGVPENKAHLCIIEEEENPSCSVYKEPNGNWLYKCFNRDENSCFNTIDIIMELQQGITKQQAVTFLKKVYNLELGLTDWQEEAAKNIDKIVYSVHGEDELDLKKICPVAYQNMARSTPYLMSILQQAKATSFGELHLDNGEILFYMTDRDIARMTGSSSPMTCNRHKVLLAYHKIITLVPDDALPAEVREEAEKMRKKNDREYHATFFTIPKWTKEHLEEVEEAGIRFKAKGYTVSKLSRELIARTEPELLPMLYPQSSSERRMEDIMKKTDAADMELQKAVMEQIQKNGYTTEKEVRELLGRRIGDISTETQLKHSMASILMMYDLVKVRANKLYKAKFGIELPPQSAPVIIIPRNQRIEGRCKLKKKNITTETIKVEFVRKAKTMGKEMDSGLDEEILECCTPKWQKNLKQPQNKQTEMNSHQSPVVQNQSDTMQPQNPVKQEILHQTDQSVPIPSVPPQTPQNQAQTIPSQSQPIAPVPTKKITWDDMLAKNTLDIIHAVKKVGFPADTATRARIFRRLRNLHSEDYPVTYEKICQYYPEMEQFYPRAVVEEKITTLLSNGSNNYRKDIETGSEREDIKELLLFILP